jgi:hypothetical protein
MKFRATLERGSSGSIASVRDLWGADWGVDRRSSVIRAWEGDLDGDGISDRVEIGDPPLFIRTGSSPPRPLGDGSRATVDFAAADLDGDGHRDLLVLEWKAGLRLYHNDGRANFEDRTRESGFPPFSAEAYAMAVIDYDRDGDQDILLAPYPPYEEALARLAAPTHEPSAFSLRIFRNSGRGQFEEIRDLPGLSAVHGVMRCVVEDFDRDGYPDLLLACGGLDPMRLEPSVILRNEQGTGFSVAAYLPDFDQPVRALGADADDFDRDGRPDVRLRTGEGIRLFRNLP